MINQDIRATLTAPMRVSLDNFERGMLPTLLEAKLGSPSSIEGKTNAAMSLKTFANSIKHTLADIGQTHFRVNADATLTDALKLTRSANHAKNKINEARTRFKSVAEAGLQEFERLNGKVLTTLEPPSNPGQVAIDAELRAWVKSQDASKVMQAVRSSPAVLAAVARAPSMLSGLAIDTHETIKNEYLAIAIPNEYEQFTELKQAIDTANTALSALENEAETMIDFDTADKFESRRYQG